MSSNVVVYMLNNLLSHSFCPLAGGIALPPPLIELLLWLLPFCKRSSQLIMLTSPEGQCILISVSIH